MTDKPKKAAPKIVAAKFVSLPSKHLVIQKLDNGNITVIGTTTAFLARSAAKESARDVEEINSAILVKQIGALAFAEQKK